MCIKKPPIIPRSDKRIKMFSIPENSTAVPLNV